MFITYAHRGASEYWPENTLSSFYAGIDMGADGVETDVQRTKDGVLVIFHDKTLERVTGESGCIQDYTYDEISAFFVHNEKYGRKDKIITLEEFLHFIGCRDLTFAIEIKDEGIAKDVIDMLDKYNMKEKTIITSFIYSELEAAYATGKGYRLGYLYENTTDEIIDKLKKIEAFQACPIAESVTPELLKTLHDNGLECRAWGVFDTDIMKRTCDAGVDGGMTVNFPDKLIEYRNK